MHALIMATPAAPTHHTRGSRRCNTHYTLVQPKPHQTSINFEFRGTRHTHACRIHSLPPHTTTLLAVHKNSRVHLRHRNHNCCSNVVVRWALTAYRACVSLAVRHIAVATTHTQACAMCFDEAPSQHRERDIQCGVGSAQQILNSVHRHMYYATNNP
jgi:hypothetical protein